MLKQKKVILSFIVLILLWSPFYISAFYPSIYCIAGYCINRPNGYFFSSFSSIQEEQNSLCAYTLSCKGKYEYDGRMSVLSFKSIFGGYSTLILEDHGRSFPFNDYSAEHMKGDCMAVKEISNNEKIIHGYFLDTNTTFMMLSNNEKNLNNFLGDLCLRGFNQK